MSCIHIVSLLPCYFTIPCLQIDLSLIVLFWHLNICIWYLQKPPQVLLCGSRQWGQPGVQVKKMMHLSVRKMSPHSCLLVIFELPTFPLYMSENSVIWDMCICRNVSYSHCQVHFISDSNYTRPCLVSFCMLLACSVSLDFQGFSIYGSLQDAELYTC